jgi:hypothetical protein
MNFKLARLLRTAACLVIGLFFFVLGIVGVLLAWSATLQSGIMQYIIENPLLFTLLSLCFAIGGLALFVFPFLWGSKKYIQIRSGPYAVILDENVVHQYLTAYFKKLFPETSIPFNIHLNKKSIQITTDLPPLPVEEQKFCLEQIQTDLNDLFRIQLGYPYEVHLLVSFVKSN